MLQKILTWLGIIRIPIPVPIHHAVVCMHCGVYTLKGEKCCGDPLHLVR